MRVIKSGCLLLASLALLSACATGPALRPTEVTRFHLGAPVTQGSIAVEPLAGAAAATSLEFQAYADGVRAELARLGYTPIPANAAPGQPADYIATVGFARAGREVVGRRSPVSIGLGGGGFSGGRGGGVGLGGGIGVPLGRSGPSEVLVTELSVVIKRRADQTALWEGRALGEADPRAANADAAGQARKLAAALFTNFPGESGRTVEIR